MEEHPDANCAGEAVQYLFRLSCNIAESPDELRCRLVGMENKACLAHAVSSGGTLAMDAMGWKTRTGPLAFYRREGASERERCGPCRIG